MTRFGLWLRRRVRAWLFADAPAAEPSCDPGFARVLTRLGGSCACAPDVARCSRAGCPRR